ncbi:uncharacterized protein [Mycetomoellerius zeteki]|uniref:uncharacterized protein n=1 Tax=Mycetomoellerius zeteki TaxID=64791 RepID=UPI00084E49AB|nr:PREDICTED: uncharacterized protein LOC108720755 [Trachymyrmex zeteki]
MLAVQTFFITYFHYVYGMFKIAGYRIEHAINMNIQQGITPKNKILMSEGIICAVDIHGQAMKLCKYLLSKFEVMLFFFIIISVACLALSLFQVSFLFHIVQ